MPEPRTAELERGRDAYERHAWEEALAYLSQADAARELEPGDLLRLAHAFYWTGSLDDYLTLLGRAYAGFVERGDRPQAGLVALMLQWDYLNKPAASLARGWYRRAERLLRDRPDCVAHGYLAQARVWDALARGDAKGAVREARKMIDLGERLCDRDLEVLGLLRLGQALVAAGDAVAGLDCLDEAVVAAVAGELGTMTTAVVYCGGISCCRELADYGRTGQWSAAAVRWCERESCTGFPGLCRIYTAELTSLRGDWKGAERELLRAAKELERFGAHAFAATAFYELGEIHRRQGDLNAAVAAYDRACELGLDPQPGLALLWLAQGDAHAAAATVAGALAGEEPGPEVQRSHRLDRARLLGAQAQIAHTRADAATAAAAAAELEAIADDYGTKALRARASVARAEAALAGGEPVGALAAATHARILWQELEMPYEAARAQVLAAEARAAAGEARSAEVDLRAALSIFTRLGAELDRRDISARLGDAAGSGDETLGLSPRELEVLRLVAAGLTDAEIAKRLFLSPHTIHRHLSNIRRKTNQPSRSGAVRAGGTCRVDLRIDGPLSARGHAFGLRPTPAALSATGCGAVGAGDNGHIRLGERRASPVHHEASVWRDFA